MSETLILSPQEERIINKKVDRHGRERVYKILERNQFTIPYVDVERAKYFTESMRETEGELLTLRWAKALKNVAEKMTVWITPDQLLAGRVGKLGRYGILYPEIDGDFYREVLGNLENRDKSPFKIDPADLKTVMEEIAPYWEGKTYHEQLNKVLPAELRNVTYDDERGLKSKFVVSETSSYRSALQWVPDYEKVLKRGFIDIQNEVKERLANLDLNNSVDLWEKKPFLDAMYIVCDAIMIWAKRHADLARDMAAKESDPVRKAELEQIAETCERVPAYPARNFREAMQCQWFVQLFSRIEQK
ncbi:MAG: glycyl radical protein, partial [Candidatus Desulfovibrio faecigallinarum]|nr:glycyl radical protein [Candidatus Desulfovibrio faecigallinarum]